MSRRSCCVAPTAPSRPATREGAWDPARGYQFMNNNVRRFMKIWECPKPVIGEITGWAVGGATGHRIGLVSHVLPADEISAEVEAEARRWTEDIAERGFKPVIADHDGPWQDYGQRPKDD
jgi:enoyl-CoA hydratase/carnithine racemase